jgi:uncharacterized RDD family membrane protein YckC
MYETMYSLKRVFAHMIDMLIIMVLSTAITLLINSIALQLGTNTAIPLITGVITPIVSNGVPIVLLGTIAGIFGWSPGKLIFFLRIRKSHNTAPGMALGILREIIKYASIALLFIGGIWALVGIITNQKTFYDDWLRLEVEDIKPAGLSETQKNWRKTFKK